MWAPSPPRRLEAAAAASALLFAAFAAPHLTGRHPDAEELHALSGARALLAGEAWPPHLGGLTRYEGGSWAIAAPLAALLAAGLDGVAATGAWAMATAMLGVGLAALWVGRLAGAPAALAVGPLLAVGSRQLPVFATVGTGGTTDFLFWLPAAALAVEAWWRKPSARGAALLGLFVGLGAALSSAHLATLAAAAVVVATAPGTVRQRVLRTAATAAGLVPVFAWSVAVGGGRAAWALRDGRGGGDLLRAVLPPRVDRLLVDLPAAVRGVPGEAGGWEAAASTGIALLATAAAIDAARAGGPERRAAIATGLLALATTAGRGLGGSPEDLLRYALPPLAAGLVLAARRWWLAAPILVLGLSLGAPPRPLRPTWTPDDGAAALGLLYLEVRRPASHPHAKVETVLATLPTGQRSALAFAYGVRAGRRYDRLAGAPAQTWAADVFGPSGPWLEGPAGADCGEAWLLGLGAGLAHGGLTGSEQALLDAASPAARASLDRGRGLLDQPPWASLAAGRLQRLAPALEGLP